MVRHPPPLAALLPFFFPLSLSSFFLGVPKKATIIHAIHQIRIKINETTEPESE